MAARGGMAEVELVEHDADESAPLDHVDRARGVVLDRARGAVGWIRRHRVLSLTVVAATLVAVVVPATLSVRADRARSDALAALPGVVAPLAAAPEVVWTSPQTPGSYALTVGDRAWIRDDVLVTWEQTGDSTNSLRAVDARTGDELWTSPLSSVPDLGDLGSRATDDATTCSAPASPPGEGVVVCLVTDSWQLTPSADATQPDLVEAATVRLRAFEAATGATVLDRPVATDASFATIDADVVLAETPATGPANLVRFDPSTGTERWRVDVPRPSPGAGRADAWVQVVDGEIAVPWLGTTALLTGDGEPVGELDTDNVWHVNGHRMTPQDDGVTQLRDLDTGRVTLLGDSRPTWVATDDGSAPHLLMLQSAEHLTGRHLLTGHRVWQLDWSAERTLSLVVVDGMLARQADDGLTVVDAGTGEQLWRRTMSAYGQSMVTDGRRLLVIESVVGTGPVVAAYDARDGRRVWRAPVPVAVQTLAVVDNRLFAVGSEGVVAFGTDRG